MDRPAAPEGTVFAGWCVSVGGEPDLDDIWEDYESAEKARRGLDPRQHPILPVFMGGPIDEE